MTFQKNPGLIQQPSDLSEGQVQISIATTKDEKEAIYKFRYQVYIEEMGKPLESADHAKGVIYDPLDDRSVLVYAKTNAAIIGTSRLTIAKAAAFPVPLQKIFSMDEFENLYPQAPLSLATKLAVKAEYRGSQVLYSISNKAYEVWREHNVQYTFGGCNPCLIPLYEQLGFQRFAANFTDPGYGMLTPLVLIVEDISHFRAVRSPFYRIARRWTNDPMSSIKYLDAFPSAASFINTQLVNKEALWDIVTLMLGCSPLKGIHLLNGLTKEDSAALLHLGAIFPCAPGDKIYGYGEKSSEIYIALSGMLLCESFGSERTLRPGSHFGNVDIFAPRPVSETVTAVSDAHILVISWQALERFSQTRHVAALQVIQNLERLSKKTALSSGNADTVSWEELS